ncbi:MAG: hypothetical protein LBJ64_04840 [Deltaproteobacteria bacterium]|jgi:uncharacterized protein YPO0396|nr:hypothetical protein [Deltaproteobacteria bacterium]
MSYTRKDDQADISLPRPSLFDDQPYHRPLVEQFRLVRFQIFNWGTFEQYHDMPVSPEGFLLTGPSGSGKTTLLDAYLTMFMPPQFLEFNSAARDAGRRDRSLTSYIRGAWKVVNSLEQAQAVTKYRRSAPVWSALALTFKRGETHRITLVNLFWIKSGGDQKPNRAFFIQESDFSLLELNDFSKNFSLKEIKNKVNFHFFTTKYEEYKSNFLELLGIKTDNALKLLQKTQSMKNIEDLDAFLRNFMLEEPKTFRAADALCEEFEVLNSAHAEVVKARDQLELLSPLRSLHLEWSALQNSLEETERLIEHLPGSLGKMRLALCQKKREDCLAENRGLSEKLKTKNEEKTEKQAKYYELLQEYRDLGGQDLPKFEKELAEQEKKRKVCAKYRQKADQLCRSLKFKPLASQEDLFEVQNEAGQRMKFLESELVRLDDELKRLYGQEAEKRKELKEKEKEIAALKSQKGNIPSGPLELRNKMAEELGLSIDSLPFAGQLMSVASSHKAWQGAVERALSGLAVSVIVAEGDYDQVAHWVNANSLGRRLGFLRFDGSREQAPSSSKENDLLSKLEFKKGPHQDFLRQELQTRLNPLCADDLEEFKRQENALTIEGQLKLGGALHEKDDRFPLTDLKNWVLGFNNKAKLNAFLAQAEELQTELVSVKSEIDKNKKAKIENDESLTNCKDLLYFAWEQIDLESIDQAVDALKKQIKAIKNIAKTLQMKKDEIEAFQKTLEVLAIAIHDLEGNIKANSKTVDDMDRQITELTFKLVSFTEIYEIAKTLNETYFCKYNITLDNIDKITFEVNRALDSATKNVSLKKSGCLAQMTRIMEDFNRKWSLDAADFKADVNYAEEYVARLQSIENDGLPKLDKRFKDLLRKQTEGNVVILATWLRDGLNQIFRRMKLVNDSLKSVPFGVLDGRPTYLTLQTQVRTDLPQVNQFKNDLKEVLNRISDVDPVVMELRFESLKKIVESLSSQERDKREWRNIVLDIRKHVEFVALEQDENEKEIEIYRSGAGKSGGQRQKLAATCLAAALRYQLGGNELGYPKFGTVVFDEAFDKIDTELTVIAIKIFRELGFQMIMATPMKNIQVLEPYIGGAVYVSIAERSNSSFTPVLYDKVEGKLALSEPAAADGPKTTTLSERPE